MIGVCQIDWGLETRALLELLPVFYSTYISSEMLGHSSTISNMFDSRQDLSKSPRSYLLMIQQSSTWFLWLAPVWIVYPIVRIGQYCLGTLPQHLTHLSSTAFQPPA